MKILSRPVVTCFIVAALAAAGVWWWRHTSQPEYLLAQGRQAIQTDEIEDAQHLVLQLEAGGFKDHAALLRGQILMQQGQFREALAQFNQVQTRKELQDEAIAHAARSCLELGQLVEAEHSYLYLLSKNPDNVEAHRGLAAVYFDFNSLAQAAHHNKEWARLDPHDGRPLRFLGMIEREIKQYPAAIEHYEQALQRELKPQVREEVRLELADCYLMSQDFAKGAALLETEPREALVPQWIILRAQCLRGLGKADQAEVLLEPTLRAKKKIPLALRLKGQLLLDQDKAAEAVSWFHQAIAEEPRDFASMLLLSQAYTSLGKTDFAEQELQRAEATKKTSIELSDLTRAMMDNPKEAALHVRMAELYQKLNMPELAARSRRNAVLLGATLNPEKKTGAEPSQTVPR